MSNFKNNNTVEADTVLLWRTLNGLDRQWQGVPWDKARQATGLSPRLDSRTPWTGWLICAC